MCTAIKMDYKDGSVMGRTMDYEVPVNYNALYLPRAYHICDDLMGNTLYSKYKTMGICFENKTPLKDGVNEYGLIGITNTFTSFNLYNREVNPEKKNISSLNYLTYALSSYRSIEELIDDLPSIHMSLKDHMGEKVSSPDFHFMFTDPTKRCIVIEPKRGELVYYENPYKVMTNSPGFKSHLKRLNKHMDLDKLEEFNASKDLPGGYDPFSRFIKAFYLNEMNVNSKDHKEAFSHIYNIMGALVMPEGFVRNKKYEETTYTRYICAYDTKNRLLTVKFHTNPTVYQLGFQDIEDKNERQEFFIESNFVSQKLR